MQLPEKLKKKPGNEKKKFIINICKKKVKKKSDLIAPRKYRKLEK